MPMCVHAAASLQGCRCMCPEGRALKLRGCSLPHACCRLCRRQPHAHNWLCGARWRRTCCRLCKRQPHVHHQLLAARRGGVLAGHAEERVRAADRLLVGDAVAAERRACSCVCVSCLGRFLCLAPCSFVAYACSAWRQRQCQQCVLSHLPGHLTPVVLVKLSSALFGLALLCSCCRSARRADQRLLERKLVAGACMQGWAEAAVGQPEAAAQGLDCRPGRRFGVRAWAPANARHPSHLAAPGP
jgi:hypothetical protein